MINRVAWGENCADDCAFGFEDLAIVDGLLAGARLIFVDPGGETGIMGNEVWNSLSVISMPVC
jgi:hypothetical protein